MSTTFESFARTRGVPELAAYNHPARKTIGRDFKSFSLV
jgi:hypothetical protein